MKLEEAIERLSKFADFKMLYGKHLLITTSQQHDIKEAINTVLQHTKHLQKENAMLENTKMNCPHLNTSGVSCSGKFCNLEDYISKDKIREKMEEIKARMNDDCLALHEFQRIAKIDVLQDLLKEE